MADRLLSSRELLARLAAQIHRLFGLNTRFPISGGLGRFALDRPFSPLSQNLPSFRPPYLTCTGFCQVDRCLDPRRLSERPPLDSRPSIAANWDQSAYDLSTWDDLLLV